MIVVNELMSIQESHLMYGIEKNPCTLRDLSERTGLHVSTIARTLKDKYYEMDGKVISFIRSLILRLVRELQNLQSYGQ